MTKFWNLFRRRPDASGACCRACGHPAHTAGCPQTIRRREFDGRREYVCACGR
jgi:hypothetical protein